VALLPALAAGVAGAWLATGSYQRAYEDRLHDAARGVALVIDREVTNHVSTLSTLAASPALDAGPDGDLRAFYTHARRAADTVGSSVKLIGPDLRIWIDTNRSPRAALSAIDDVETTRSALDSGRPAVSNLVINRVSGHPAVIIRVPVLRNGHVVAVLGTRISAAHLSALLAAPDLSGDAVATITDGQNIIMARSREAEPFIGRRAPNWYVEAIAGQTDGFASGETLAGEEVKLAFQRISGTSGWTLMILEPIATYQASWRPTIMTLAVGGAAALAFALAFAMWLGGRVLTPIALLKQQAEAVAAGENGEALGRSSKDRHMPVTEFEALREAIARAGLTLAASERRHRALAETGAAALWRAEPDGHLLESRGWEILTGQNSVDLRGSGWLQALHPDDIAPAMAEWQRAMAEHRTVSVEYRVRTREGPYLWHRARGVPILNEKGDIEEWFGVVADIHDRKAAEAALAASDERMRALVDTAPDAIVVMDASGIIQSFNQGAERIFDYTASDVIGRNISMLMPVPHAERHDAYIADYLHTGKRRVIGSVTELDGRRKDGTIVPLEASISKWRDAAGALFFTEVLRDITERRAAEERQTLLAREVDHRAKNALAVVQSVLRLTPANDVKSFAAAVEARVAALARAHSLLAQEGWTAAELCVVAKRELAAHARQHEQEDAIVLSGPPCRLASTAVQPIAMVLHELATNASKHGALSAPSGKVKLAWNVDAHAGLLHLHWTEGGGPPVTAPSRRGFGSRVIEATVRGQLGGAVVWHWKTTGLIVEASVPLTKVTTSAAPAVA
jgi:PAS domain S-box-containing protein